MKTIFQQLGPYEILQVIGHGMAGSVFLARDTRTDQCVALKLVPHGTDRDDMEIVAAERWGAELQKQLGQVSARVPTVYEHGDHESGYYVAMEYLDGENLSTLIARGPLAAEEAANISIELCLFLEDAHRFEAVMGDREFRSLVHGDLTPRNVRITASQKVKVLDFGIAKALSLSRKVTRNDFGTLWYLSPERLESGVVDEYADFWAVGVMLYEMVHARRPFLAEDTRRLERLILSRHGAPSASGSCPRALESVIAKLLAATPEQRYISAQAIREDLERFKRGEPTDAEREGWPKQTTEEAETRRTQPPIETDENEKTRRTTKGQAAAAVERRRTSRKVFRTLFVLLFVVVIAIAGNEAWVAAQASDVAESVPTCDLEQMGVVWDRYNDLSRQSLLQLATIELGRSLTQRSTQLADRVIADYRTSLPTVREAQWQSARDVLARAVAAAPSDRQIKPPSAIAKGTCTASMVKPGDGKASIPKRKKT